jgi:hypothetical protein
MDKSFWAEMRTKRATADAEEGPVDALQLSL